MECGYSSLEIHLSAPSPISACRCSPGCTCWICCALQLYPRQPLASTTCTKLHNYLGKTCLLPLMFIKVKSGHFLQTAALLLSFLQLVLQHYSTTLFSVWLQFELQSMVFIMKSATLWFGMGRHPCTPCMLWTNWPQTNGPGVPGAIWCDAGSASLPWASTTSSSPVMFSFCKCIHIHVLHW